MTAIIWKANGFVLGKDRMAFWVDGDGEDDLGVEWKIRVVFLDVLMFPLGAKGVSLVPPRVSSA